MNDIDIVLNQGGDIEMGRANVKLRPLDFFFFFLKLKFDESICGFSFFAWFLQD